MTRPESGTWGKPYGEPKSTPPGSRAGNPIGACCAFAPLQGPLSFLWAVFSLSNGRAAAKPGGGAAAFDGRRPPNWPGRRLRRRPGGWAAPTRRRAPRAFAFHGSPCPRQKGPGSIQLWNRAPSRRAAARPRWSVCLPAIAAPRHPWLPVPRPPGFWPYRTR